MKHHTVVVRNGDASLFLGASFPGSVSDSVAGARRGNAGRAAFAGSGVRPRAATYPGRHRHIPRRSTAGRGHNASRSVPGADTGHTETIGHRPSLPPGEEGWTIRAYTVILGMEPCESADLGATPDVTVKSSSPGLRRPLRCARSNPSPCVPSPAGEIRSREPATHVVSGANQIQPEEFEAKQGASARSSARHRRIAMTRMFAKYTQVSIAAYSIVRIECKRSLEVCLG